MVNGQAGEYFYYQQKWVYLWYTSFIYSLMVTLKDNNFKSWVKCSLQASVIAKPWHLAAPRSPSSWLSSVIRPAVTQATSIARQAQGEGLTIPDANTKSISKWMIYNLSIKITLIWYYSETSEINSPTTLPLPLSQQLAPDLPQESKDDS